MAHAHILAPSLIAGSIIHLSFPGDPPRTSSLAKGKGKTTNGREGEPVVRELPVRLGGGRKTGEGEAEGKEQVDVDVIKRIVRSGSGREGKLVLADANYVISVCDLLQYDGASDDAKEDEENSEDEQDAALVVQHQYALKHRPRAGSTWTGLEASSSGVLSSLSSGLLSYNTYDPSPASHRILPSGLLAIRGVPSSASTDLPRTLAMAGKSFEVSLWDTERTLGAGVKGEDPVRESQKVVGQKRKIGNKKEMEEGEVWRARNMPNNHLDLPTPIHHTCLTVLTGPNGAPHAQPQLATGTLSGHVRVYDTRQRKNVSEWKVAREGGMGAVEAGRNEHELFFSDRSSLLGALDLRTGKVLYTYAAQTSTPLSLLPLPYAAGTPTSPSAIGLATVSSDATLRLCSTSGVPSEGKGNVRRGEIVRTIGGVGLGNVCWLGWGERAAQGDEEDQEVEVEREEGDADMDGESAEEDEDLFDQMGVVEAGEEESDSDADAAPRALAKKAKGGGKKQ